MVDRSRYTGMQTKLKMNDEEVQPKQTQVPSPGNLHVTSGPKNGGYLKDFDDVYIPRSRSRR